MQMDHGVEQPRTVVAFAARSLSYDCPLFVNDGEHLLQIVFHCFGVYCGRGIIRRS